MECNGVEWNGMEWNGMIGRDLQQPQSASRRQVPAAGPGDALEWGIQGSVAELG